jgi:hypothetical protein
MLCLARCMLLGNVKRSNVDENNSLIIYYLRPRAEQHAWTF